MCAQPPGALNLKLAIEFISLEALTTALSHALAASISLTLVTASERESRTVAFMQLQPLPTAMTLGKCHEICIEAAHDLVL